MAPTIGVSSEKTPSLSVSTNKRNCPGNTGPRPAKFQLIVIDPSSPAPLRIFISFTRQTRSNREASFPITEPERIPACVVAHAPLFRVTLPAIKNGSGRSSIGWNSANKVTYSIK